jgi:hypothetical protein
MGSLVLSATLAGSASAEQKLFNNPKLKGLALDWCRSIEEDCGKPAADAWCVKQGYESALKFSRIDDIGEPTRVISKGQICDEDDCDAFGKILCERPDDGDDANANEPVRFNKPMAGSRRLDYCLGYATGCGKPAANYYCQSKGYDEAVGFKIASNVGKTRILKTGQKCSNSECDGFKFIDCE